MPHDQSMAIKKDWERFLFEHWGLAALELDLSSTGTGTGTSLRLLDVLVRKRSQGRLTRDPQTLLINLGNVRELRSLRLGDERAAQLQEWHLFETLNSQASKPAAAAPVRSPQAHKLRTIAVSGVDSHTRISRLLHAYVTGCATGSCGGAEPDAAALLVAVEGIHQEQVPDSALLPLFTAREPAWVPDRRQLADLMMRHNIRDVKRHGDLELWVVVEILYCTALVLTTTGRATASAQTPGVLRQVPTNADAYGTSHMQAGTGGSHHTLIVSSSTRGSNAPIPMGFRAIRMTYSKDGRLVSRRAHMGSNRPALVPSYGIQPASTAS